MDGFELLILAAIGVACVAVVVVDILNPLVREPHEYSVHCTCWECQAFREYIAKWKHETEAPPKDYEQ